MRYAIISLVLFSLLLTSIFIPLSNPQDVPHEPFAQFINLRIEAIGDIVAEVEPTSSHIFYFKFYNGGYFQTNLYAFYVEFKVTVEGEGWTAYVSPTWTFFYPNETRIGHVYVTASARPSNYATIRLYGKLRDIYGNWHHANYTFHVKSAPYHSFDVLVEKPYIKAKQEGIYSVPIKIINYGNYEDYFEITPVYIPPNWHCIVSQNKVILSPGQETTVYVHFVTPPEGIYKQGTTHILLVEVKATRAVSKIAAIVVMVEGFHLTLGQTVAILSSLPTLLAFISVGFAFHRVNSPSYVIPKPWKEEKEELAKLNAKERKKILKEMKEEWLSAIYFYKEWKKNEKQHRKLRKIAMEKQRKLENKIKAEWNEAWLSAYNTWKEERKKIKGEYEARKQKIQELYEKIKKIATKMGVKIDMPTLPKLEYPPEPKKPPMPKIPEYRYDEKRGILIEPDEIEIEKALIPIRRNKLMAKREAMKIREMGREIIKKMNLSFDAIEKKLIAEMEKLKEMEKREMKAKKIEELKRRYKK